MEGGCLLLDVLSAFIGKIKSTILRRRFRFRVNRRATHTSATRHARSEVILSFILYVSETTSLS